MSEEITISSFDELIKILETSDLSNKEAEEIVSKTIGIYMLMDVNDNRDMYVHKLKSFWKMYKDKPLYDRPIFLIEE